MPQVHCIYTPTDVHLQILFVVLLLLVLAKSVRESTHKRGTQDILPQSLEREAHPAKCAQTFEKTMDLHLKKTLDKLVVHHNKSCLSKDNKEENGRKP